MAEPLTHKPFEERLMALNADAPKKKPTKASVTRIHPTVVVRHPSDFRTKKQEEPAEAPTVVEPEPVAKKKRSPKSSPEQREIAVARVTALTKAGENRDKALKIVGKEMGYATGSLNRWLVDANNVGKQRAKGRGQRSPESIAKQQATIAKKKRRKTSAHSPQVHAANGSSHSNAIGEALTLVVRDIVTKELKRLLSQGVG